MSRNISEETKLKQGRCATITEDWKAWIKANEFSYIGTRSMLIDWKTGRTVHCLSQVERDVYILLRWNDHVKFICEQVRLNPEETTRIANELCFRPVRNGETSMTTDFIVVMENNSMFAVSVKYDKKFLASNSPQHRRMRERLAIEKRYFEEKQIPWIMIFRENINKILVHNIFIATEYYDSRRVFDKTSYIKHLIARKELVVDMETGFLNFAALEKEVFPRE